MISEKDTHKLLKMVNSLMFLLIGVLLVLISLVAYVSFSSKVHVPDEAALVVLEQAEPGLAPLDTSTDLWQAPNDAQLPHGEEGETIKYGRELIANTSVYFGPNGSVRKITNGLNCQNCHLDAGTKPWGNNYASVASTYPKMRGRSGTMESVYKRISDCFERSLDGTAPDSNSREMNAMKAYILWLGKEVPSGQEAKGSGIYNLAFLDRAADPINGEKVYEAKCQSCHQPDGKGILNEAKTAYTYPPLWGPQSYNDGAGLYRLSRFAGYVKANMPLGASYSNPLLSDEEAWDVAAFVNSQKRPVKELSNDWPDISKKTFDHPFGPFVDPYTEKQHKYGPFKPIKDYYKSLKKS